MPLFRRENGIFRNLTIFVLILFIFDGLPRPMNCFKLFDYKTQFNDWVFLYPKKNLGFFKKSLRLIYFCIYLNVKHTKTIQNGYFKNSHKRN